jgi:uncharacterized protein (TIGR03083 family)
MSPASEHVIASIDGTSLTAQDYLAHLRSDAARLRAVTTDLDAPVPSCPGWTAADLLTHLGSVYSHKTAAMVTGAHPEPDGWSAAPPEGVDLLVWFDAALDGLVGELATREPQQPCWTWWPPDQTVGFWHRRMAQETLVHRWDAELAAGSTTALDPALATDGVDEILGWLAWELDQPMPVGGQHLLVRTTGRAWAVRLEPTCAVVTAAPPEAVAAPGGALVEGEPEPLLLHLWGRGSEGSLTQSGAPATLRAFADRVAQAT